MIRPSRLFVLALAVLLSGCMFFETRADRNLRHQPNFRAGYDDGCATANAEGANMRRGDTVRDDALYDADKAYRVGWAQGHATCRRMAPTGQAQGPLRDVQPGGGH
ncbi:MAG TPA: hypothetical protein VG889_17725 [Rhizomicrobium sp.]|nr:hypothetical protein [Rhizomicrobium sp.]